MAQPQRRQGICPKLINIHICYVHIELFRNALSVRFRTVGLRNPFSGCQSAQGGSSLCQAGIYLIRLISRAWIFSSCTFRPATARRYTIWPPHSTQANGSYRRTAYSSARSRPLPPAPVYPFPARCTKLAINAATRSLPQYAKDLNNVDF